MATKKYDPSEIGGAIKFYPAGPGGEKQDFEVLRLTPHPEYDVILYPNTPNATPIRNVIKTALAHLRQGDTLQARLLLSETADALGQVHDMLANHTFTGPVSEKDLKPIEEKGAPKTVQVDLSHDGGKVETVAITHDGGCVFHVETTGCGILPFEFDVSVGNDETVRIVPIIVDTPKTTFTMAGETFTLKDLDLPTRNTNE